MAETSNLDRALSTVCCRFTNSCLNPYQKKQISEFVKGKSDIFINLPTSFTYGVRKSLTAPSGHIVVVVSPLVNLMRFTGRRGGKSGKSSVFSCF